MDKNSKKFVNPRFARKGEYKKVIEKIISEGRCPFCPENFNHHKNQILKKTKKWFITKSSWPYKNSEHHFLVIGKSHKEFFTELDFNDFKEVKNLVNWAIKRFNLKGGALNLRFGSTDYTGATVNHLHFHLIIPKSKNKKSLRVNFPIG